MIIFITGGVRSGKSSFAQKMALNLSKKPVYLATAKIWDDDFYERIKLHQAERGPEWTTYEGHHELHKLPLAGRIVVVDCVTLWLTNFFTNKPDKPEEVLEELKQEIENLFQLSGTFIIISNEIGMGMHADTPLGRKFADLQGWVNQFIAERADEAIFMVSGLPLYLKKIREAKEFS